MRESGNAPVVLSEDQHQEILTAAILPAWTQGAVCQVRPVAVFVAGQPGSGKTVLADLLHATLDRRGGAVRIGRDLYKAAHQHYAGFLAEDVRTAGVRVRPDTRRWQQEVEAHARAHRFDVVVETALADPQEFRTAAAAYRQAGSRIEVVALAVPEAVSQLGILDRYLRHAEAGTARFVSWENHDQCAAGMLRTLAAIEAEQLADRVVVVRRGAEALYDNELDATGTWRFPPTAHKAVAAERSRPWNAAQTGHFRRELAAADRRAHDVRLPTDWGLAVQRDAERAAAWAEPVRRTAQPRTESPGLDYHRLAAHEHAWIFDELIVPSHLVGITPQERPAVVYVMGQPGVEMMDAIRLVHRALPGRTTWLTPETFTSAHPDYFQLMEQEPRAAEERIRADCGAWQVKAEAYVRRRRGNLIVAVTPGSAEEFLTSAASFRQAGYRIELVALAMRPADSRQGSAAGYARMIRSGPATFTSVVRHDQCLAALLAAVQAAEQEQEAVLDSVVVLRQDRSAVYRNHRGNDGRWIRRAGAAHALVLEQQRPYTLPEAMRFLSVQRWLRAALPQYRDELLETEELARPLLPAQLQRRRLEGSAPPAALPLPAQRRAGSADHDVVSFFRRAS
ncbi:zeta toxin family protein (plasmid) [Streptoverticillium reticulum]|uniref:zeta toxin family protein n=1 Tax=Streptoverticillium reticulum TaxID=1433415 RepID=UPI0039BFBE60